MRRIHVVSVMLLATLPILASCSGSGSGDSADHLRGVHVEGSGKVTGAPDILNADLGVEVTAPDVSSAIGAANAKAQAVIDAVTHGGVAKADVRTTDVSLHPDYAVPGQDGGSRAISGYQATNSVHIVVRDLSKASQLLNDAVKAGGDASRLNGVSFAIDDNSKLLTDARAKAFNDAKNRAQQYAELAGKQLGDLVSIDEQGGSGPQPPSTMAPKEFSDNVPLEPGTQTVTFTVNATWALK